MVWEAQKLNNILKYQCELQIFTSIWYIKQKFLLLQYILAGNKTIQYKTLFKNS